MCMKGILKCFTNTIFRFEDGTINFLDIVALYHGFEAVEKFTGTSV